MEVEKLSEFKVVLETTYAIHLSLSPQTFSLTMALPLISQLHYPSLLFKWSSSYFMGYIQEEASLIGCANSHQLNWPLCQVTSEIIGQLMGELPDPISNQKFPHGESTVAE